MMTYNTFIKTMLFSIALLLTASLVIACLDWRTNVERLQEDIRINNHLIIKDL